MNSKTIKSKTLSLVEIFNNGSNCFEIPNYQRAYSWETTQRDDLMEDLENILTLKNYKHFTGTIVAQEKENKEGFINYDIVDGQQRLTSIIILLSVLAQGKYLNDQDTTEIYNNYLFKGKETGNTIRLFKLNGELDKYFFRKLEQWDYSSEEHATKAHTNINNAFTEFKEWLDINVIINPDFPKEIYSVIIDRIVFLFHVPETSAEVGLMFEVINNRGKKLSELEKIKNYLIYYAEKSGYQDIKAAVDNNWGKILFNLNACHQTSNDDENAFLRYTWIVFEQTNKSESYHVYNNLKQRFPAKQNSNWQRLKLYIEFIAESAETYNKILTRNLISHTKERKVIEQIFFQASTSSILPLLLSVYSKIKDSNIRIDILSAIEKLNFRYYGCGIANRSDSGNGHLFWLAHVFFNQYGSNGTTNEWLKNELIGFIQRECGDENIVKALTLDKEESGGYYSWNNLKYFLANYEESIAVESGEVEDFTRFLLSQDSDNKNANFEKEHIIATNECSVIVEADDVNKRRLGNFVLLRPSINKSIKHAPLFKKLIEYKGNSHKYLTPRSLSELEILYGSENVDKKEVAYTHNFVVKFLDKREEKLINFALKRWGFNNSKKVNLDSLTEELKIYKFENESIEF
nr:DUF262 domain-containing protein [uncultured Flavobacterium sp.]